MICVGNWNDLWYLCWLWLLKRNLEKPLKTQEKKQAKELCDPLKTEVKEEILTYNECGGWRNFLSIESGNLEIDYIEGRNWEAFWWNLGSVLILKVLIHEDDLTSCPWMFKLSSKVHVSSAYNFMSVERKLTSNGESWTACQWRFEMIANQC